MTIEEINDRIEVLNEMLSDMQNTAESGADWAEICRIEKDELVPLLDELHCWQEANSQFGVGA